MGSQSAAERMPAMDAAHVGPSRVTVCFPFCGDELGGSHVSARGLIERLDLSQFRPLIVPEVPNGTISRFFSGFEQVPDPAPPARPLIPGQQFGLAQVLRTMAGIGRRTRFLRTHGVEVVHSNDGRSHASWGVAAKLAGARLLWHHRGDPDARGLRFVAPWLADQVLTVSGFALPPNGRGALRSAEVVYSPFDTAVEADRAVMRQRIVQQIGCPEDAVLCGWFGNFVKRKRPLAFVEVVERLGELLDRPVIGLMFGDQRNTQIGDALPQRIATMQSAGVHMMGYRTPGHEWLAGCDMLLVPAVREPLGRTLVEAMLVGTPVVATQSGGNAEALEGGCGVLCPADDVEAMARAATDLLADPTRLTAMCARAAVQARLRFSAETHVRQVSHAYDRLLR